MWTLQSVLFTLTLISSIVTAQLEEPIKVTAVHAAVTGSGPRLHEYGSFPPEKGIIIGDIRLRDALSSGGAKWPEGRVPYVINSQYSPEIVSTMTAAMREIEQDVNGDKECVKFTPRTNEANYIEIYPGSGCHTEIGTSNSGRQGVSIGADCESRGTILHELVHVLGLSHEHCRLDRDSHINVNMNNVMQNHTSDYAKVGIDTFNTTYDFSSITHYDAYTHCLDPTIPVITPLPGQAVGVKIGQRMALSDGDVTRIQRMYGCQEDTSHIFRPFITDRVLSCDFENDRCNFTQNVTHTFQWTVTRGASGAGPRAGNTNGADGYLAVTERGHNGTARVATPLLRVGSVCVTFFFFQRGPSYLNVVAWGPRIARTVIATYQGDSHNQWYRAEISINVPAEGAFKIIFEAKLSEGDVAIDDVFIYRGQCL